MGLLLYVGVGIVMFAGLNIWAQVFKKNALEGNKELKTVGTLVQVFGGFILLLITVFMGFVLPKLDRIVELLIQISSKP